MEEIKGMSDHEARKWLMKHGYGLGEIDAILNVAPEADPNADAKAALMRQGYGVGEAEMLAAEAAPAPKPEPKPEPVKAAPAPKAEPVKAAPAPKPKTIPQPAAQAAPKVSK